jgi:hypothetical protein
MKTSRKFGAALAALFVTGAALAAVYIPYIGFNPLTGINGLPGQFVDLSLNKPVITAAGQTISAQVGGAVAGAFVATGTTTGAFTFTYPQPVLTGFACSLVDITTTADSSKEVAYTTTTVTFAGTIVSGDLLVYECVAF